MSGPAGDRTEKATPQRMKKVRQDGSLGRSQDLSAWLVVGAAAISLPMVVSRGADAARGQLVTVEHVIAAPDLPRALDALGAGLGSILSTLTPLLVATVLAAVAAAAVQGGISVSGKRLKPKFKGLNPVSGIKRILGPQAWWQGVKSLLKTAVVGGVLYLAVIGMVPLVLRSGGLSVAHVLGEVGSRVSTLLTWAVAAGLVLAAADVAVVIRRNRKQTRMSKHEVKEENKRSEGDPLVKGAIRAKQRAMSRNRMLAAVADADVVVVNPTHIAVALRYEVGKGAPRVVAKGKGHVATRIRERATEHRVAVVQDVPLARTLVASCEVGQEVPAYLYEAVARVLAFVMSLRRRGTAAGTHRLPEPRKGR